jgi:hypothetical protein
MMPSPTSGNEHMEPQMSDAGLKPEKFLTPEMTIDLEAKRPPAKGNAEALSSNDNEETQEEKASPRRKFTMDLAGDIVLDTGCQYLIKSLMPSRGVMVLYGQSGTGKSFLALDAALHVAAGRSWAGKKVSRGIDLKVENGIEREVKRGVVYIASEGGHGFKKRIVAAMRERKIPASVPFALITDAPKLGDNGCELDKLIAAIERQEDLCGKPRLIIFDTLACSLHDLNESDSSHMSRFTDKAKAIGKRFKALVLLVHHSGKDEERGMRGSSALRAAVDATWHVKFDADDGRSFNIEKMKDGASGYDIGFSLEDTTLGTDTDGDTITTKVIGLADDPILAGTAEDRQKRKVARRYVTLQRAIRAIVEKGTKGTGEVPRANGLADERAAMARSDLAKAASDVVEAGKIDKQVYRDFTDLVDEGALVNAGDWYWLP